MSDLSPRKDASISPRSSEGKKLFGKRRNHSKKHRDGQASSENLALPTPEAAELGPRKRMSGLISPRMLATQASSENLTDVSPEKETFTTEHERRCIIGKSAPVPRQTVVENGRYVLDEIYQALGLNAPQRLMMFRQLDSVLTEKQHQTFKNGRHLRSEASALLVNARSGIDDMLGRHSKSQRIILIQSCVRRWNIRRHYLNEEGRFLGIKQRNHVFDELLTLEKNYTNRLESFIQPLRKNPIKGIEVGSIAEIFSNLEDIHRVHVSFSQELRDLMGDPFNPFFSGIGELFLSHSDQILPQYENYVENFHIAVNTLDKLKEEVPKFADFLDDKRKSNPDMLVCRDSLSLPLQHISKWESLLSRIVSASSPQNTFQNYEMLVNAHTVIHNVTGIIEGKLKSTMNNAKMLAIQRRIESESPLNLTDNGQRILVREGPVAKVDDKKSAYLFLFTDVLLVTEPHSSTLRFVKRIDVRQDSRLRDLSKEKHKFVFRLSTGDTEVKICTKTSPEKAAWMADIVTLIHRYQQKRVFGMELEKLLAAEEREIPCICEKAIGDIRERGLDVEGIFRVPGDTKTVQELKIAFDAEKGNELDFSRYMIHDVAGVLKLYFRELPDPLFPYASFTQLINFYNEFEAHGGEGSDFTSHYTDNLAKLIASLPECNRRLLKYLLDFMNDVVKNSALNMMSARNIAVVFAPNIIRPLEDTMETALLSPQVSKLLCSMIEYSCPAFWESVDRYLADGDKFVFDETKPLISVNLVEMDSPMAPKVKKPARRDKLIGAIPIKRIARSTEPGESGSTEPRSGSQTAR